MRFEPLFKFPYTNTRFDKNHYKGGGIISQFFGEGKNYYKRVFDMDGHNGIDYAVPTGTEILAPCKMIITAVKEKNWGYGIYTVAENKTYKFIFAHCSKNLMKEGDLVTAGFPIALSGNSGNSTGSHLHFDITPLIGSNNDNGFRGRIDPLPFFEQEKMTVDQSLLSKLYTLVFHREIDANGFGYSGKEINLILDEFAKSEEWQMYDKLYKIVKDIEKTL